MESEKVRQAYKLLLSTLILTYRELYSLPIQTWIEDYSLLYYPEYELDSFLNPDLSTELYLDYAPINKFLIETVQLSRNPEETVYLFKHDLVCNMDYYKGYGNLYNKSWIIFKNQKL